MIDWNSLSDKEISELHESRKTMEAFVSEILMAFERDTELQISDISLGRMGSDGKGIWVSLSVPMRVIPPQ